MTYYNTTGETGAKLVKYRERARSQEQAILAYFKGLANGGGKPEVGPSELYEKLFDGQVPITSVRRAITCLTNKKKLVKTGTKRKGFYGRQEHCWRLANPPQIKEQEKLL